MLRARLALLVASEEALYSERQAREQWLRLITSGAVLLEILVLLIVLNGIRARLVVQATEALRQKESIERQAVQLEISNAELAQAFSEKERAQVAMLEEAVEQAALLNAITEVFFVIDRDGFYQKVAPTS